MKLSLWQVEALAAWVREHDDPEDDTLSTAHVTLAIIDREERVVEAVTEAGARLVMWHDGTDVTADYPTPTREET